MIRKSFNPDFFARNRRKLKSSISAELIVITANGLVQKTRDDDAYPFAQEGNFWYLTGLDEPDLILVIDANSEYIILPKRSERFLFFSGQVDQKKLEEMSGIKKFYDSTVGWQHLADSLKKAKKVATLKSSTEYDRLYDIYTNPAGRRLVKKLKSKNSSLEIIDARPELTKLRQIKSAAEIDFIKTAIKHTQTAFSMVSENFINYKSESEIESEVAVYRIKNKLENAFMPIIANGKNACILHYQANSSMIDRSDITLIDMGFSYNNYCADITRCISKNPTKRQKSVHDAVIEIANFAFKILKPGILPQDYEVEVAKYAGEKLRELGLIKTIDFESMHEYYRHRTSHFLGIDVHDDGDYEKPFQAGMVVTVEPGIYIEAEGIGIRIEDDALITDKGNVNLSKSLSRSLN